MEILYVSNFCSDKEYGILYGNASQKLNQQAQKFNGLLAKGLAENDCKVTVLSGRPINNEMQPTKFFCKKTEKEGALDFIYPSSFNYPKIRQITLYISARKLAKKWLKNNPDGIMICDVLNISLVSAVAKVFKRKGNKTVGIVTDLPRMLGGKPKVIEYNNKLIADCDKLIILAEEMNTEINVGKKPYIVIEGFADKNMENAQNTLENKYPEKVVTYTGLLHKKYGVANLVEGFLEGNIKDAELHIYGVGDYADTIKTIAKEHKNVKYFGTVDNKKVVEEQMKATLLVNPRPNDEEFVKFSFPSKNMEYMASGTPMLTTVLPSMPSEYYDYIFIMETSSKEIIASKLKELLSKDKEELHNLGLRAKEFVLKNKNNVMQAKKIKGWL